MGLMRSAGPYMGALSVDGPLDEGLHRGYALPIQGGTG